MTVREISESEYFSIVAEIMDEYDEYDSVNLDFAYELADEIMREEGLECPLLTR